MPCGHCVQNSQAVRTPHVASNEVCCFVIVLACTVSFPLCRNLNLEDLGCSVSDLAGCCVHQHRVDLASDVPILLGHDHTSAHVREVVPLGLVLLLLLVLFGVFPRYDTRTAVSCLPSSLRASQCMKSRSSCLCCPQLSWLSTIRFLLAGLVP